MTTHEIAALLQARFGEATRVGADLHDPTGTLAGLAGRGSCRAFRDRPVALETLKALCAIALAAPSKSDLQQRDFVIVQDPDIAVRLKALAGPQPWIDSAPALIVACADNRRQRQLHRLRGRPFANDHVDALFNASVDAAIALGFLIVAAEAAGLGCCPISTIRDEADAASDLLALPDHVFPVAALAIGWPSRSDPQISMRLPLTTTVHVDRFDADGSDSAVAEYDRRRGHLAGARQRQADRFGTVPVYTWSDDKTRQYSRPERAGFGAFLRRKGFVLE